MLDFDKKMGKIIRLTESDLVRIVKRVISEGSTKPDEILNSKGQTWKLDLGGGDVVKFKVDTTGEYTFTGTITSRSGSAFSGIDKGGKISGTIDHAMGDIGLQYKITDGKMKLTDDIIIYSEYRKEKTDGTLSKV